MDSISSTPADIHTLIARLGVNSVHLQIRPNKLGDRRGLDASQAWQAALKWVDAMLLECKKERIVGIVEVSGVPIDGITKTNPQNALAFWHSSRQRGEYFERISSLAHHLAKFGNEFAAYDVMSEPVTVENHQAVRPPDWFKFQSQIITTIREVDPNRWIVVTPGPLGESAGYRDFSPLPFSRLVYSIHMYDPHAYTSQGITRFQFGVKYPGMINGTWWDKLTLEADMSPVIQFQEKYNTLIYVGEFSALRWSPGAESYIKDLVSIFNSYNWGWAYFAYNGWNGWNPNYNADYSTNASDVDRDYVGVKSKRWATLRQILPIKRSEN